jgi:predicted RNA-binding protein YlxR (DUF448 family)
MSVEPIRTCAGCAGRAPKATLLRFVGRGDGLSPDPAQRAAGRGAYLHRDPQCFDAFVRRRGPVRSLRRSVGRPERERFVAALAAGTR